MAGLLLETGYQSGKTLYSIFHNQSGQVWRNDTHVWEAFNGANWASYAVALTEQGTSGYYSAAYPSQIDLTTYIPTEVLYQQIAGSPAQSDYLIGIGKSQGVNVSAIAGNLVATLNMSAAAGSEQRGTVAAGTISQTQVTSSITNPLTGAYVGRAIIFTSGQNIGCAGLISAYNPTGGLLTFSPVPVAPLANDTFVIV